MEEQFDIRTAPLNGQMVIEASAGTGKTHSIVQLYLRLLVERRLNPEQILVVTFTDAATGELKERIRSSVSLLSRELKGERVLSEKDTYIAELLRCISDEQKKTLPLFIDASLNSFDEASIFTIHGFCRRVLRDHAFEYNTIFNSELLDDIIPLAEEVTIDYYRKNFYGASRFFVKAASSRNISVGTLMNLLREVLPKSDLRIIPDDDEWKKIDLYGDKILAAFDRAKSVWDKYGKELGDLFRQGDLPLDGRTYQARYLNGRIAEVDEYFNEKDLSVPLPDKIKYFLPEFIQSKHDPKKKGSLEELINHPAAKALETLHAEHSGLSQKINHAFSSLRASYLRFAKKELEKRKELRNLWSFDDLLTGVRKGLNDPVHGKAIAFALRKRYPVALIDEFQDTDAVQCDIFENIFNHPDSMLYYIGDPKQAIYTFRGADVHAYIAAKTGKPVRYKGENWRSHEKLVKAVNAIFSAQDPFMLGDSVACNPVGSCADKGELVVEGDASSPMIVWAVRGDDEGNPYGKALTLSMIRRAVACELSRLLTSSQRKKTYFSKIGEKNRPLRAGDCAVIVRTNSDALAMKETLRSQGIPSVIARSGNVYESPMKQALDLFLYAVHEGREGLIRSSLASDLFLCDAETIAHLTDDPARWETYLESFREYRITWERFGFMSLASEVIRNGIYENVARSGDGVRKLADLIHLIELYHRAAVEGDFGPVELLAWSAKKEEDERSRSDEHRTRLETDDDAVKIVTIHAAKGLEYPVVFTACGWDFRDDRKKIERVFYHEGTALVCDLTVNSKDEERAERAEIEERAENLRLYYVALTRASHRCYTVAGKITGYEKSAAGYLFHSGRARRSPVNNDPDSRTKRYQEISTIINDLSPDDMLSDLGSLAGKGEFAVRELPLERGSVFDSGSDAAHDLVVRKATREIHDDWKISSFSYIVAARSDDHEMEYDEDAASTGAEHEEPIFPKGPEAGSCIHGIFEILDYSITINEDSRQEVRSILSKYNLDQEERAAWVEQLCKEVFAKKLPIVDMSLASIVREKQVRELEFYFPAQYISASGFREMLLNALGTTFNSGFTREISLITFERFAGFLKGFMDLVFEHEGKYFILDWKTNYLGESVEDYSYKKLCREMDRHLYTVQAVIYSLALHLFLKSRLKDYRFDAHFGGVIYLFVRGINSGGDEGIWEWRPEFSLIDMLDKKIVRRTLHE